MARSGFTGLVVQIDQWQANSPSGGEVAGDWALVGPSGSGAFAGQSDNAAYYTGAAWRFIAATALRGVWLFKKSSNEMYFHSGSSLVGPLPSAALDTDGTLAADSDTRIATQKAVKTYVDTLAQGVKWKAAVRVATVAAGTLASSFENGDTIDGIMLATSDRILIKNQAAGAENGIYTVNASGAPTRATDADTGAELVAASVVVLAGSTNADKAFVCTNDAITLNSTSVVFVNFANLMSGVLLTANNLSEIPSPGTARSNLSVYSISDVDTALAAKLDSTKLEDGDEDGQLARWDHGNGNWVKLVGPSGGNGKYYVAVDRAGGVNGLPYWDGPI